MNREGTAFFLSGAQSSVGDRPAQSRLDRKAERAKASDSAGKRKPEDGVESRGVCLICCWQRLGTEIEEASIPRAKA